MQTKVSSSGEWRIPRSGTLNGKYKQALLAYEDKYFYVHPGLNLFSIFRALKKNLSEGRIVQGGSTITQQLARMLLRKRNRGLLDKLHELYLAIGLELQYSKDEILDRYASNAPMGGNTVGIDGAAWRYWDRGQETLSWAEVATLAVLPNAPGLIHLDRNREILLHKRNSLLARLWGSAAMDADEYERALLEKLPSLDSSLPQLAPTIVHSTLAATDDFSIKTTLNATLQRGVYEIVTNHQKRLDLLHVYNSSVIIADIESGNLLSYVANRLDRDPSHDSQVDIPRALRSPGSTLKPFLYWRALVNGLVLPRMLVADTPVNFDGFSPKNSDGKYRGAVPADEALYRSLNVPAVHLLRNNGVEDFLIFLRTLGFESLSRSSDHYGLALILGGGEVSMLELANGYRHLALAATGQRPIGTVGFLADESERKALEGTNDPYAMNAAISVLQALQKTARPEGYSGWEIFSRASRVAWKTGTSYGARDAWAVGITGSKIIVVWVGNADGEGRPGISGTSAAAPILFDILSTLGDKDIAIRDPTEVVPVCAESGYPASANCEQIRQDARVSGEISIPPCPYHKKIFLHPESHKRVDDTCFDPLLADTQLIFELPPLQDHYFRKENI